MAGDRPGSNGLGGKAAGRGDGDHPAETFAFGGEHDFSRTDSLHWLDADDDDYIYAQVDSGRVIAFALAAVLFFGAIVGGVWWFIHHKGTASVQADGSVIPAPPQPYKEAPRNPGGKTLAGTGNISYGVAQGIDGAVQPYGAGDGINPSDSAETIKPTIPAPGAAAAQSGVAAAQLGAYGTPAAAEAAWSRFAGQGDALKGVSHRVVEGNADIGKVYRLQVVAGSDAGANALCGRLKASGIPCQVKH